MSQINFPDVSRWQGVIDWDALKASGRADTVLIKVTGADGGLYVDSQAARNISEARRVGIPAAFYVYKGDAGAADTARHLIATVGTFQPGEFVIADDENEGKVNTGWDAEFIDTVKGLINIIPPIYSNLSRFQGVDLSPIKSRNAGLHVAAYGPNDGNPHTAPGGLDATIIAWQYTSAARVPGITANTVDMNIFYGSVEDWKKYGVGATSAPQVSAPVVTPAPATNGSGIYTVVSGDTLSGIGAKVGVAWPTIAATNGITAPYTIFPGQKLKVYGGTLGQAAQVAAVQGGQYVVVSGDTLSGIGAKTGHSWQDIASLNGIGSPYTIYPGQRLNLPGGGVTPAAAQEANYVVVSGDTLSGIGAKTGRNWQAIASLNGIGAPYTIYPNQVLRLP